MGKTNSILFPWYKRLIKPKGDVALLGFDNNELFDGDLYDLSLGNWEINSKWNLNKKYDTIICTRCAYFSKDPEDFILRCYDSLNPNGKLYVDWGLGDHWRFANYKIGWTKGEEHEYAYDKENFLWSCVWDDSFLDNHQFRVFQELVLKFGYTDVKKSIFEEVPVVLELKTISKYFDIKYDILSVWKDFPQLYIFISGEKNNEFYHG